MGLHLYLRDNDGLLIKHKGKTTELRFKIAREKITIYERGDLTIYDEHGRVASADRRNGEERFFPIQVRPGTHIEFADGDDCGYFDISSKGSDRVRLDFDAERTFDFHQIHART